MMRKLIHNLFLFLFQKKVEKEIRFLFQKKVEKEIRFLFQKKVEKEIRFLFQKVRLIMIGFSRFASKDSTRKSYISL
jgi:hypothetical protein